MIRALSFCTLVLLACDEGAGTGGASSASTSDGAAGTGAGGATSTSTALGGGDAGGAGAGGAGTGGGVDVADPCEGTTPACDTAAPSAQGGGLVPLDRCGWALDRGPEFSDLGPLVDGLATIATPVTLADVLADLNRQPIVVADSAVPGDPPGVDYAFRWEMSENTNLSWVPQGLTGSPDASPTALVNGRKLVLVSAYFDEDVDPAAAPKGVRLAMVDVTDPAQPAYRFLLLVEPTAGPSWKPVRIHAGGIAWFGDYLYVADTSKGLRVFDLRRIFQADTSVNVIGCDATSCKAGLYKYALPQVGAYRRAGACDPARFSFVALDRTSTVPNLVTGEYCATTACTGPLAGRVFRYALDPATGLLSGATRTYSTDAYFMGETQVQGAVSAGDTFFFSSSEPAGGAGALYTVDAAGSTTHDWIDTPEDLMIDTTTDRIWSLSEGNGARFVFSAALAGYL